MKRALLILLFLTVLAGYLGTLIARDPGYVLVTYDGFSMQTSLWVMLTLLVLVIGAVYLSLRGFGMVRRSPLRYQAWQQQRRGKRAGQLTNKGLSLLAEGEAERARKYLESGATQGQDAALNYLAAARAANAMGDHEARESLLRKAGEADARMERARIVVAAEMALDRGDADAALTMLSSVKVNDHIIRLRERALRMKGDWREALQQLPDLRGRDKAMAARLECDMALAGLSAEAGNDDVINQLYRSLSNEIRQRADVMACYVRSLADKDQAEPLLRSALKKNWHGDLVRLYGALGSESLNTRRKTAEAWQRKHPDDADLQFCLGCIYEASGAPGLARECFAKSVDLEDSSEGRRRLGLILIKEGQYERGREYLVSG